MPDESHLVEYDDNGQSLIVARTTDQAHYTLGIEVCRVNKWMTENSFSLASLLWRNFTKETIPTVLPIQVGETMVKCRAIMIKTNISFLEEIHNTADKTTASIFVTCRDG